MIENELGFLEDVQFKRHNDRARSRSVDSDDLESGKEGHRKRNHHGGGGRSKDRSDDFETEGRKRRPSKRLDNLIDEMDSELPEMEAKFPESFPKDRTEEEESITTESEVQNEGAAFSDKEVLEEVIQQITDLKERENSEGLDEHEQKVLSQLLVEKAELEHKLGITEGVAESQILKTKGERVNVNSGLKKIMTPRILARARERRESSATEERSGHWMVEPDENDPLNREYITIQGETLKRESERMSAPEINVEVKKIYLEINKLEKRIKKSKEPSGDDLNLLHQLRTEAARLENELHLRSEQEKVQKERDTEEPISPAQEIVESLGSDIEVGLPEHDEEFISRLKKKLNHIDNRINAIKEKQKLGTAEEEGGAKELERELQELGSKKQEIRESINGFEGERRQKKELGALGELFDKLNKEGPGSLEEKLIKAGSTQDVAELLQTLPSEKRTKEVLDAVKHGDFIVDGNALETKKFQKFESYDLDKAVAAEGQFIESEAAKELLESLREEIKQELIEKMREQAIKEEIVQNTMSGCELHKNLRAEINKERQVPKPQPMSWLSRVYLSVMEGDKYAKYSADADKYKAAQKRIKNLEIFEKTWAQKEHEMADAWVEAKIESLLYISDLEAGKELDQKALEKVMAAGAKAYARRATINNFILTKSQERIGIKGEPPKITEYQAVSLESEFYKNTASAYAEATLKGLEGKVDKEFIREQAGGSIRTLAELSAKEVVLRERLKSVAKHKYAGENIIYQTLVELTQTQMAIKKAETALETQLKWHEASKKLEELGKSIKEGLKKEFGKTLMKVDPEFEIKYDTALSKIILSGQSNFAHTLSSTKEMQLAGKQALNRSQKAMLNLRRGLNKKLNKMIPESERIAHKLTVLEDRGVELDEKNRQIKEVLAYITSEKAGAWEKVLKKFDVSEAKRNRFRNRIIAEIIETVARTEAEKERMKARLAANSLTDNLIEEIQRAGEMKVFNNSSNRRKIEIEKKELEEQIKLMEHQYKKAADQVAKDSALDELADLMEQKAELAKDVKYAKTYEEAALENLLREVEKLRTASEKHLAKKLTESFKKVA